MNTARLMVSWSIRRIRSRLLFWWELVQLVSDWTTLLYVIIPAAAVAVYDTIRYYGGHWTVGLSRTSTIAGHIPAYTVLALITSLVFLIIHFSMYGHIAIRLESGDAFYLLLSPISRKATAMTMFVEGWLGSLLPFLFYGYLTAPVCTALGISIAWWTAILVLAAGFESAVRLLSQLYSRDSGSTISYFLIYQSLRFVSFAPLVIFVDFAFLGRTAMMLSFSGFTVFTACVVLLTVFALPRHTWEAFYRFRPNPLLNVAIGGSGVTEQSRTHFLMRRPSAFLVRSLERIRHRRLHALTWLIVIRGLRRKNAIRDILLITSGVLIALGFAPFGWLKTVVVAFCGLLVMQWWSLTIKPLYERPVTEQTVVNPWTLRVKANQLRMGLAAIFIAIWIVLWYATRR